MSLKPGDPAPDFSASSSTGQIIHLRDLRGRRVVLYFYPMDDTPGCTAQACSLRDFHAEILATGTVVLGVSAQSQESHERFAQKHALPFPLLVDDRQAIAKAYGAAGSGVLGGLARGILGLNTRITYVIDGEGRIAHVIDSPDCPNHGEEVLRLLQG